MSIDSATRSEIRSATCRSSAVNGRRSTRFAKPMTPISLVPIRSDCTITDPMPSASIPTAIGAAPSGQPAGSAAS